MRIYKTEEFVKLPDGTVFGIFPARNARRTNNLCVKTLSVPPLDFHYLCLTDFEAADGDERYLRMEQMRDHGASFPGKVRAQQHGVCDPGECFLVYETEDLCCMSKWFAAARVIHRDHETREQVA